MAPNKSTSVRIKLVQFGDVAVDQSSVVLLCVQTYFQKHKEPYTGGPTFMRCTINNKEFQFKIPESARPKGHLQFVRFENARAAVVAFNLTKSTSLDKAKAWVKELQRVYPNMVIALIGTKIDLVFRRPGSSTSGFLNADNEAEQQVIKENAEAYARDAGLLFFESSASTGDAVVDAFKQFASMVLLVHVLPSAKGATGNASGPSTAPNCGVTAGSNQFWGNDLRLKVSQMKVVAGSETEDTHERKSEGHFKDSESEGIVIGHPINTRSPLALAWPALTGSRPVPATSSGSEAARLEEARKSEINEEEARQLQAELSAAREECERKRERAAADASVHEQAAREEQALTRREEKLPERNASPSTSQSQLPASASQVWRRAGGVAAWTNTAARPSFFTPPGLSVFNSGDSIRPIPTHPLSSFATAARLEANGIRPGLVATGQEPDVRPSFLGGLQKPGSWREREAPKAGEARQTLQISNETLGPIVSETTFSLNHSLEQSASIEKSVNEASQAHSGAGRELNTGQEGPIIGIEEAVDNFGGQGNSTESVNHDCSFTLLNLKQPPSNFEVSLVRRPLNADDLAALQVSQPTPASEVVAMIPFEYAENALAYCLKTVSELLATLPPPTPDELVRRNAALTAINNIALHLREERVPRE